MKLLMVEVNGKLRVQRYAPEQTVDAMREYMLRGIKTQIVEVEDYTDGSMPVEISGVEQYVVIVLRGQQPPNIAMPEHGEVFESRQEAELDATVMHDKFAQATVWQVGGTHPISATVSNLMWDGERVPQITLK